VRLLQCEACGCATTFPVPDGAELAEAYGTFYRPQSGRFSGSGDRLLSLTRGLLARRIDRLAPPGPVLDVGSGPGALLDALQARDREAVGLERESGRADVRACELADFTERKGEWAAVVMWHSLEHLRDASVALERACELLAPGGLLIVSVPNRASWQARYLGDRWLALDLPRHLVHLTSAALVLRLGASGMTVERVSHWRGGQVVFGWLDGLVGSLPSEPDLYDAIRRPEARQQPIGAGRRALTLAAAVAMLPAAAGLSLAEITASAGGTVMVEARR
jgi:SAM-dependent methyltransferase